MPLYEYRCEGCGRKVTLLVRTPGGQPPSPCPGCGSADLTRLFSTFRVMKTDRDVYEDILGDNQLVGRMMNNDPKALAEWNRKMSRDDSVAPEYEEMVDKMDHGEWPAEVTGQRKAPPSEEKE